MKRTIYAAGRSSVTFSEIDFAGSGTEIKIAIMATNAASDIKLSTDKSPYLGAAGRRRPLGLG